MPEHVEFETPENIQVRYRVAGLGSRFIAWFADQVILFLILFVLFIVLEILSQGADFFSWMAPSRDSIHRHPDQIPLYFFGMFLLVAGLGGFVYFTVFELLMRGQTPGKRSLSIRVAKVDGFSLDLGSIVIRNVFRVLDQIPALWIVPFLAPKCQRLGDMVAGTVVIADDKVELSPLREQLLNRPPENRIFSFDSNALGKARPVDFEAAEKILERWENLGHPEREMLLTRVCGPLAERLNVAAPSPEQRIEFLKDFLAAEYRRRLRQLG